MENMKAQHESRFGRGFRDLWIDETAAEQSTLLRWCLSPEIQLLGLLQDPTYLLKHE